MRYDLATMAGPRRRKRITLRPIEPSTALAEPIRAEAQAIITAIRQAIVEELLPIYEPRPTLTQDADTGRMISALRKVKEAGTALVANISGRLANWAVKLEQWHRFRFGASVKAGTGVDVIAFLSSAEAQDQTEAALAWASSLITNVQSELLDQIESRVWAAYSAGTPRRELGKELAAVMQISRKRADRIAQDQTAKLAANLDQMRQLEAGIKSYEWRHSGKLYFRPAHKARDGKTYRWDQPPDDGHPGQAIFCGCRAMPVLELE